MEKEGKERRGREGRGGVKRSCGKGRDNWEGKGFLYYTNV